jgi:L-Ala-D/L-Glu epimerase
MIKVDTVKVSLPLKKKFVISKGQATVKTNLITVLNNRYSGEASGSVYYGPSIDEIQSDINRGIEFLSGKKVVDQHTLEEINEFDLHPAARSALIAMTLNYISGETNRYPWEILGIGSPVGIRNSITISIDTPEQVKTEIEQSEYPIIKLKLGSEHDAEIVLLLKDVGGKEIRVDANGAWTLEQAEEMIHGLAMSGVKVIEQPTAPENVKEWPHLKGKNEDIELIIDEGLATVDDYISFAEYVDGVNIKMVKSGGIIEAIRIATRARQDKKKVMLGCMVESSVGIAQSIYMSSLGDYYDLDGPQLLDEDIASGISYDKDSIAVDREIIGGPKLKRDIVEKYIQD